MNVTQFLDFIGVTELWENIKAFILGQTVELTFEEYLALSDEEKNNGVTYYITDGSVSDFSSKITVENSTLMVSSAADGSTEVVDGTLYV